MSNFSPKLHCTKISVQILSQKFFVLASNSHVAVYRHDTMFDQWSYLLHELLFLMYHSQIASCPFSFASYSSSCKSLQPYIAATVQTHSDAAFSICASRMKTVTEN